MRVIRKSGVGVGGERDGLAGGWYNDNCGF